MEIGIACIPHKAGRWDIVRAIAEVLHSSEFGNRKENFDLELTKSNVNEYRNGGTGFLILPSHQLGIKFLRYMDENDIRIEDPDNHRKRKLRFFRRDSEKSLSKATIEKLAKMPFVDPDKEEKHQETLAKLTHQFRVDSVQFGVFYRDPYPRSPNEPLQPRSFSIEYKQDLLGDNVGWLEFKYDHKLLLITVSLAHCCILFIFTDSLFLRCVTQSLVRSAIQLVPISPLFRKSRSDMMESPVSILDTNAPK
jgi:RNA-dependent RNA polymerase